MAVDYVALLDRLRRGAPFVDLMGVELTGLGPDTARAEVRRRDELLNAGGTFHAGVIFGLADVVAGGASLGLIARVTRLRNVALVTAQAEISYRRPAIGHLVADAALGEEVEALLASWEATGKARVPWAVTITDHGAERGPVEVATARVECVLLRRNGG